MAWRVVRLFGPPEQLYSPFDKELLRVDSPRLAGYSHLAATEMALHDLTRQRETVATRHPAIYDYSRRRPACKRAQRVCARA